MEHCETEIVTFACGRRSRFRARGVLERGAEQVCIRYRDEGDAVTLTLQGGTLAVERAGKLSARFCEGEETRMTLYAAGMCGEAAVRTEKLRVSHRAEGLCIVLCYRLRFSAGEQSYALKIAAEVISEEE